jgi:hypothetical protein
MKSLEITVTTAEIRACNCAPAGIRTPNLLIRSQMLYPLSYGRKVLSDRKSSDLWRPTQNH